MGSKNILGGFNERSSNSTNNYGSDKKNIDSKTTYKQQTKKIDNRNHIIFNFGIDRKDTYFGRGKEQITVKGPLFLLESKLIILV